MRDVKLIATVAITLIALGIGLQLAGCASTEEVPADASMGTPPRIPGGCGTVSETGACIGDTLVRCDTAADKVVEVECRASGQECVVDRCVDPAGGADAGPMPDGGPGSPDAGPVGTPDAGNGGGGGGGGIACDTVPAGGWCNNQLNTAVYCEAGKPYATVEACGGQTCMENVCGYGAQCCTAQEYESTCAAVGEEGVCLYDNVAVWCDADGELHDINCTLLGKSCGSCAAGACCI